MRTLAPISIDGGTTVCARDFQGRCLARLNYGSPEQAQRAFLDLRARILNAADETALCIATDEWAKAEQKIAEKDGGRSFLDRMLGLEEP